MYNFYLFLLKGNFRQSWTKVLTHLSKTNAFYRCPSVIEKKKIFFVNSQTPLSPFSMLKYAPWTLSHRYNIEKGRGGRNVKIADWKTHVFNETGFFQGVSQLLLYMFVSNSLQQCINTSRISGSHEITNEPSTSSNMLRQTPQMLKKIKNHRKHIFKDEANNMQLD